MNYIVTMTTLQQNWVSILNWREYLNLHSNFPRHCWLMCKKLKGLKAFCIRSFCCDMGQIDTIGKIELNPSFVLSSNNINCKNDIQLFPQLFDELRVNGDCH